MPDGPDTNEPARPPRPQGPNLLGLLKPYTQLISILVALTILGNGLNLLVPADHCRAPSTATPSNSSCSAAVAVELFFVVARHLRLLVSPERGADLCLRARRAGPADAAGGEDLRPGSRLSSSRSRPPTLLTNLTSDVDAIKMFVSQAIASIISSVFLIIGASVLLLSINWKLGLARPGHPADHRRDVLRRARQGAEAVHQGAGSDRLAEQGHQRKHPGLGADPAAELAALRVREVPGRQYRGAGHQPEHPAAVRQPDSGDHLLRPTSPR